MTPIERMKAHHRLHIQSRNKAMVARRQHNPMIIRVGGQGQGHPGTKANLDDELEQARCKLNKTVRKFTKGEVTEKTLKAAEVLYITLVRKSHEAMHRMKGCQASVEHWEGAVQTGEIFIDALEAVAAKMRRVS